jgi:hypothetical protein
MLVIQTGFGHYAVMRVAMAVFCAYAALSCEQTKSTEPVAQPSVVESLEQSSLSSEAVWQSPQEKLSAIVVPGFKRKLREPRPTPNRGTVWLVSQVANSANKKIKVRVSFSECTEQRCPPLGEAPVVDANRALAARHAEDPKLVFETYELDLGERKALVHYARSFVEPYALHELKAITHNGVHRLNMTLSPKSQRQPTARSSEDLLREMPKAELEAAARDLFKAYGALL